MQNTVVPNSLEPTTVGGTQQRRIKLSFRAQQDRVEVMNQWHELEQRLSAVAIACSYDWTDTWLNHFGDLVPYEFVLGHDQDGELRSIVLLTHGVEQKDGPLTLKTLHVGTAGEPEADSVCIEYNDLLVHPDYRTLLATALQIELANRKGIDQWNLDGFGESDAQRFSADGSLPENTQTEVAHWFDLAAAREKEVDLIDQYRSANRRKIRRNLEQVPEATVEWGDSIALASEIFEEQIQLHQQRWNSLGKSGSYSSDRFTRFHEELLVRLVPQQRMALVRVRSGNTTIGCTQLFNDQNRALLYQCGWTPSAGRMSPGLVADFLSMQECSRRGYDAFDFLAFETQHKRTLSNASSNLVWARHRRKNLKFAVLNKLRRAKSLLRRRAE